MKKIIVFYEIWDEAAIDNLLLYNAGETDKKGKELEWNVKTINEASEKILKHAGWKGGNTKGWVTHTGMSYKTMHPKGDYKAGKTIYTYHLIGFTRSEENQVFDILTGKEKIGASMKLSSILACLTKEEQEKVKTLVKADKSQVLANLKIDAKNVYKGSLLQALKKSGYDIKDVILGKPKSLLNKIHAEGFSIAYPETILVADLGGKEIKITGVLQIVMDLDDIKDVQLSYYFSEYNK